MEDLSDQIEEREANRREKPASKSDQVEVSLPSSCSTASSELATFFFLVWWRLWRPSFFQRRLSTTIAQRAFQHGLLATRISKRRDFLTCVSSSTGPSNFLATPFCPVMRTQTIIVKVVYWRAKGAKCTKQRIQKLDQRC